METSQLLKQETNLTLESLHDFAKWKLIVTATLAAAGMGLTPPVLPHSDSKWLLLLIPYTCAYVDLNCYQYLIRIIVLSRFLKEHQEDPLLQAFEQHAQDLHQRYGVFNLGQYAQIGVSLVACLTPLVTCVAVSQQLGLLSIALVLWIAGLCLVIRLWYYYKGKFELARTGPVDHVSMVKIQTTGA
jgi:hypothetical protein